MAAYRFCRSDDIGLLADALNRCWAPYFPGEPLMTPAAFKRTVRDLQVWCSSCMVAFSGGDPIAVLIGAKRPCGTLIHRLAVHPDHRRRGHGRHLLASLGAKLAILGPPRIAAEVPERLEPARGLFTASGFVEEAPLTDYVLDADDIEAAEKPGEFVIPVTVADLVANGCLGDPNADACWERSAETLAARQDEIKGLAIVSDERIEAHVLYQPDGAIVSLRSVADDDVARLKRLCARLRTCGVPAIRYPKVHPSEMSAAHMQALGFRPAGVHRRFAMTAGAAA
jgi:GNAT superfamily N-acetyltransferase